MSDNFWCPLPWNHLMFKSKGTVQACCESYNDQFYPSDTIRETANDPVMKQLRLDLLDPDKIPKMCNKCEVREGIQNFSVRINSIFMHKQWTEERARSVTNKDGSVDNFNLEHLDIRWSNLCNYKCRFCQYFLVGPMIRSLRFRPHKARRILSFLRDKSYYNHR